MVEKGKGPWQTQFVIIEFQQKKFWEEKMKTRKNKKKVVKFDFFFLSKLPFLGIY